jgi:uncharacterized protein involved in response to NO
MSANSPPHSPPRRLEEAAPAPSWRWLLAAPHRLCFFGAVAMLAAATLGGLLAARGWLGPAGAAAGWAVAPSLAHGLVMVFGFIPLFIAGFQFTAGPRWLQQPAVPARGLVLPVTLGLAGWAVFGAGVCWRPEVAGVGLLLCSLALMAFALRFLRIVRRSSADEVTHALLIAASGACASALLAFAAIGVAFGDRLLADGALRAALWTALGLAYVSAMHRLVPFFDAAQLPRLDAAWPDAPLWVLAVTLCGQGALAMADALGFAPRWAHLAAAVWGLLAAGGVFALAWRWSQLQPLRPRLVRMLHTGFVWLGIALALAALAHAGQALGRAAAPLQLAALHALGMGFMAGLMLAMVTRVSCAHSGRAVVADRALWVAFLLLQAATVTRVAAALWPAADALLLPLALLAFAASVLPWTLRSAWWYLTPGVVRSQAGRVHRA